MAKKTTAKKKTIRNERPSTASEQAAIETQDRNLLDNNRERIPLGKGLKLEFPNREGYHRTWAIDKPGELVRMERAWYKFVVDERGNKITVPAGNGFIHYLMEIEEKYYKEDTKRASDERRKKMSAMMKCNPDEYAANRQKSVVQKAESDPIYGDVVYD